MSRRRASLEAPLTVRVTAELEAWIDGYARELGATALTGHVSMASAARVLLERGRRAVLEERETAAVRSGRGRARSRAA